MLVAVVNLLYSLLPLLVLEAAGVHLPLVHQVSALLEATVGMAPSSPS
jgi:hypothetical protein